MTETNPSYCCEKCDYSTPIKCNYEKHLTTKRHLGTRKIIPEYYECKNCDFKTNNSYNYNVHMKSNKHLGIKGVEKKQFKFDDIKHNKYGVLMAKLKTAKNEDFLFMIENVMKAEYDQIIKYIEEIKKTGLKLSDFEHLKALLKIVYNAYHFTYILGDKVDNDEKDIIEI